MTPELCRRLGAALGTRQVTATERWTVARAAEAAETWPQLPKDVQALVVAIEGRPAAGAHA